MTTPILATKLYVPPPRAKLVLRTRLIARLDENLRQPQGFERKLSLISAPAGFGKTTLLSEWVAHHQRPTAWLSLERGDNDLKQFLAYLIAALGTVKSGLGAEVLALLESPPPLPTTPILTTLLNEISTLQESFILVLDDYHVIESEAVDQALVFLLEHLPAQMHLVILSREDPRFPLARLRGQGQVTELRAPELRFSATEVSAFLNQMMDLDLNESDIEALESRTEGWVAGLHLAALALQGLKSGISADQIQNKSASDFIHAFTGEHRFILDYLVEEVLQHQPKNVQAFLLKTSILNRLCSSLCDALLQGHERSSSGQDLASQATLDYIEKANLLLIPLDDHRQWFRYHHLFADVLRERLLREEASHVSELHRRACAWYAQNNLFDEAIYHALTAKDYVRAADMIEMAWTDIRRSCFQSPTWLGWVSALPAELVMIRPVLTVGYAWELLNFGEMEAAEAQILQAERLLYANSAAEMIIVNESEFSALRGSLANARAYHAQVFGDVTSTIEHAQQALRLAPESDHYTRGIASTTLGLAHWTRGDLETAYQSVSEGMTRLKRAGNFLFAISGTFVLAHISLARGRLHQAIRVYTDALQLAANQGDAVLQGTADLYLGLSELQREQGLRKEAGQNLAQSQSLGDKSALPDWPYRLSLVQAKLNLSRGDLEGALDHLDEAENTYYRVPIPDVQPIPALRVRIWLKQGRTNEAFDWVTENGLTVDAELDYLCEFEYITFARILLERYVQTGNESTLQDVHQLLTRLLAAAELGGRLGSVIEIFCLQALAWQAQKDIKKGLVPLARALELAESQGFAQLFLDEGPSMVNLLKAAKAQNLKGEYVARLLELHQQDEDLSISQSPPALKAAGKNDLIEPLTTREGEVLSLIAAGHSNPEIADQLVIAVTTVKTHVKNIFGKLQVSNRVQAVARAKELKLL